MSRASSSGKNKSKQNCGASPEAEENSIPRKLFASAAENRGNCLPLLPKIEETSIYWCTRYIVAISTIFSLMSFLVLKLINGELILESVEYNYEKKIF